MTAKSHTAGTAGNQVPAVLADLNLYKQWVGYNADKKPLNPRGGYAEADNPSTWGTRAEADKRGKGKAGIEFGPIIGRDDLCLAGVDLDGCRDLTTKAVAPWAREIIAKLGTYTELSPSGKGLHALFLYRPSDLSAIEAATPSGTGGQWKPEAGVGVEFYFCGRYFTVTDDQFGPWSGLKTLGGEAVKWIVAAGDKLMAGNVAEFPKERAKNFDEASTLRDLMTGVSFHPAAISLGGYWAKTGVPIVDAFARLKAAFEVTDEGDRDDRWKARFKQIPEILQYAYGKDAADIAGIVEGFDDLDDDNPLGAAPEPKPKVTKTEAVLADNFAEKYRGALLYNEAKGQWYFWEDHHWKPDRKSRAFDHAVQVCRPAVGGNNKAARTRSLATTASAVMKIARADSTFSTEPDHFDRDQWLLGTPTGTVDLRTGKLRDGAPSEYISKLTAAGPIPRKDFNAERDCPQWLKFLQEATGNDAGMIRFLKQWFGYCLTGVTREQQFFFVHGEGGNGKGTLINTIGDLLGDYCLDVDASVLSERKFDQHTTEIARLAGARMVRTSETTRGVHWNQQRLTKWTGGDPLTGRFMHCDDVTFMPVFKLNILGNHKPALHDVNEAIKRRVNVVPFTIKPEVDDKKLREKLDAEWPGILAWLIEGCLDWQEHGLVKPKAVLEYTAQYLAEQDTPTRWVAECLDVKKGYKDTFANFYASWSRFARADDEEPGSKISFADLLVKLGLVRIEIPPHAAVGYSGAKLKPQEADHVNFTEVKEDESGLI